MSGFLSGTSKFLDSVQSKKNGLMSDISTKFNAIRMPGDAPAGENKRKHGKRGDGGGSDADDGSSASEYGDDGDRPMYAEQTALVRQESVDSVDSLPEAEAEQWRTDIKSIVKSLFAQETLSSETKANFQNYVTRHTGRSTFAREVKQRASLTKAVSDKVLNELAQFVSHVLVHCNENDDFIPAAQLMQSSFTVYHETKAHSLADQGQLRYLYSMLKDQPIWQSMRFWNAAFFAALQSIRRNHTTPKDLQGEDAIQALKEQHDDATFLLISRTFEESFEVRLLKE